MKIIQIKAHEILDSRGIPTVETFIKVESGHFAVSSVASGKSMGSFEALELRDGDNTRFGGKGVLKACANVNQVIAPILIGMDVEDQQIIDEKMIELDGTENKARLGSNAILSVSQACLKLASVVSGKQLFSYILEYFGLTKKYIMPVPALTVIDGGKIGNEKLDFQEFQILPRSNQSFNQMLEMAIEIYGNLKILMQQNKIFDGTGDDGGYVGNFVNNTEAFEYIESAITKSNLVLNQDIKIGLDAAGNNLLGQDMKYYIRDKSFPLTSMDLANYYHELSYKYDWGYLEDCFSEEDLSGWKYLMKKVENSLIIGDDLVCTNPSRLSKMISEKVCNAVLVKPNQIGTITEFVKVVEMAKKANFKVIMSHRSGETNDSFIADMAVGIGASMVKFGAPARGERIAKYNRLLEIEDLLKGKG